MNKKRGRKIIKCSKCNHQKLHYGLGMCSSCLRKNKRQTRPSFYLGTCYSEISRRCKVYDSKRPNYYGKLKCTKEEFMKRFLKDKNFLKLYKKWQKSNYQRKFSPSIDRINNKLDYTLDNLQFISQNLNSKKDWQNPVLIFTNSGCLGQCESQLEAAKTLGVSPSLISRVIKNGKLIFGMFSIVRVGDIKIA